MARGGYQEPSNPAPVSGPGAMSQRTDGGQPIRDPGGLPYGENQELRSTQAAAPMSGSSPQAQAQAQQSGAPLASMSPSLFDQSDAPAEPVTAGMPFGAGPGSEVMAGSGGQIPAGPTQERLLAMLPMLVRMAESPYTSQEFKAMVYGVRSSVSG